MKFFGADVKAKLTELFDIGFLLGGGYYSASNILVQAKLMAAAGTNGQVQFTVAMIDGDVTPTSKTNTTTYHIDNLRATGAVVYPGAAVVVTNQGFVSNNK